MAARHEGKSERWVKGTTLYEYKVVLSADDTVDAWEINNTEADIEARIGGFPDEGFKSREERAEFMADIRKQAEARNDFGHKTVDLIDRVNNGTPMKSIPTAIEEMLHGKHSEFFNPEQYASLIPHLIIYPTSGYFNPVSVKRIKIK